MDVCVAAQLAGCIAPGVPVGVWLAHRIDNFRLRVVVSTLLVIIGGASLIQMTLRFALRTRPAASGSGSADYSDSLVAIDELEPKEIVHQY